MSTANEKRIAKNTVFLFVRMLFTLGISLYTSRVVLDVLGVRDYGIYNVVGGLILILSFLNGTMSGATQRFLNYEMGLGKDGRLRETFTAAWTIHLCIAGILLVLGETLGLWFVNSQLVIEPARMTAANWTYQFSLLSGVLTVMLVPFNGAVFAHERMNVYAVFTIIFTLLKLGVALLLVFVATADNLIIYAGLMAAASGLHFLMYFIYCLQKFPECSLKLTPDRRCVKNMLTYSGSDLVGTLCYTTENQGVLVILNRVGGTVLNAAGGLTMTVTISISQFGSAIIMAFRPQIIKQYAAGNFDYMMRLMVNCSKYSILLLSLFAIPAFVEMPYLLGLWLKEVPDYTVVFCRLTLLMSISQMAVLTLNAGMHATGDIFKFSIITGLSYLLELPVMYIMIRITDHPEWAYYLPIIQQSLLVLIINIMLRNRISGYSMRRFILPAYVAPAVLALAVGAATSALANMVEGDFLRLLAVCAVSSLLLCGLAWTLLLTPDMRAEIIETIRKKLHRA